MRRSDATAVAILLALGVALFGPTIPFAGFHLDDFALDRLFAGPWSGVWRMFCDYVPGRNLFVLYEAALYAVCGGQPIHLHLAGLALDLLNILLFYVLLRKLGASTRWAFLSAGLFLVYPNHGESHFWTFAIAQNLIPVTLVLAAALWIARDGVGPARRFGGALLIFLLALFDYDQVFILWIPLVMIGLSPERGKKAIEAATVFAALALAADVSHVLFRHLAKVSAGGRPVITLSRFFPSARASARALIVPMVKLPRYESLGIGPLAPWLVALLCAAAGAFWILASRRLNDEGGPAPAQLRLIIIGLAWTACSYFPNLFWYLSPRHHYLPSAGWLMALAGVGALLAERLDKVSRRALAVLAAVAFGLAASFDFAEGRAWARSSRMLEGLAAELRAQPPADNIFVIGAPTSFGPAPGLANPGEAHFMAGIEGSDVAGHASLAPAVSRRGLFVGCEADLFGDDLWSWRPFAESRVIAYDGHGGFARAGALSINVPGSSPETLALGEGAATARLSPPLWLMDAKIDKGGAARPIAEGGGVRLLSARLNGNDLELGWSGAPGRDVGFLLSLDDPAGRLFEPRTQAKGGRETLWPAYDDLIPSSAWSSKARVKETWRLRLARPPTGPVTATLRLFERSAGPWTPLAVLIAPVSAAPAS